MVRRLAGRRSSVVERTLGKGEVDSSILSGGTSEMAESRHSVVRIGPGRSPIAGSWPTGARRFNKRAQPYTGHPGVGLI